MSRNTKIAGILGVAVVLAVGFILTRRERVKDDRTKDVSSKATLMLSAAAVG
jgi:hypothetical protein